MRFCVPASTRVCLRTYVHGYARAHTCARACLRVCTNALVGVHACVCVRTGMCACLGACTCACVRVYLHMRLRGWERASIRVCLWRVVCVCTRVCAPLHKRVCVCRGRRGHPPSPWHPREEVTVCQDTMGASRPGSPRPPSPLPRLPIAPRPPPPPSLYNPPREGLGRGPRGRASHGRVGRRVPLPTASSGQRGRSPGRLRAQPGLSPPAAPVPRRTRLRRRRPGPGPCALVCCHLVLAHGRAPVPARGERREPIARGLWARRGGQCPGSGCRGEATYELG